MVDAVGFQLGTAGPKRQLAPPAIFKPLVNIVGARPGERPHSKDAEALARAIVENPDRFEAALDMVVETTEKHLAAKAGGPVKNRLSVNLFESEEDAAPTLTFSPHKAALKVADRLRNYVSSIKKASLADIKAAEPAKRQELVTDLILEILSTNDGNPWHDFRAHAHRAAEHEVLAAIADTEKAFTPPGSRLTAQA